MIDNASLIYGFLLAHNAQPPIMQAFKVLAADKIPDPKDWIGGVPLPGTEIEPSTNHSRSWTKKSSEIAKTMWEAGATLQEIAAEVKRTPGAVSVQLSKLGAKRKRD